MTLLEWKAELSKIPAEDRWGLEERAAIHQFDGGLEKDEAERRALAEYWQAKRPQGELL